MKPSSARPKNRRALARNAALLNLLAWPGLGSLLAGERLVGLVQMAVFFAGFLVFCAWAFRNFSEYYQLMFGDVPPEAFQLTWRLVPVWAGLCLLAWCWSLFTNVSLSRTAARERAGEIKSFPGGEEKLEESKIIAALAALPEWSRHGETIAKTYEFKDFSVAMKFVNAVADRAERVQHHPDMDVRWNKVTLALTTHDAGGLTEKDFAFAHACDALAQS